MEGKAPNSGGQAQSARTFGVCQPGPRILLHRRQDVRVDPERVVSDNPAGN
jgi:hypothetical protein